LALGFTTSAKLIAQMVDATLSGAPRETSYVEPVCYAPPPDIFDETFELDDLCRWSTTAPSASCAPPICGDGLEAAGEACDDGNTIYETVCAYGLGSCACCDGDCSALTTLEGPYCGDGYADAGDEVCDDGNTVDETECDYGIANCVFCSADCQSELYLSGPYCGDGNVDNYQGEVCDDFNTSSCGTCSADCQTEQVGGDCPPGTGCIGDEDCASGTCSGFSCS